MDIRKYNFRFTDTCDFNNVYLWMKPLYSGELTESDKNNIIEDCNKIKTATVEIVPCSIVETIFLPYVKHPDYPETQSTLNTLIRGVAPTKIVVTKKPTSFISGPQLKETINKIFTDYFSLDNQKIGNIINITDIYKKIIALGYVDSIQTKYVPDDGTSNVWIIERFIICLFYINFNKRCRF